MTQPNKSEYARRDRAGIPIADERCYLHGDEIRAYNEQCYHDHVKGEWQLPRWACILAAVLMAACVAMAASVTFLAATGAQP